MEAKITKNIEKAKRVNKVEEELGAGREIDPQYEINALRAINTDLEVRLLKKEEELKKCKEEFINGLIEPIDLIWREYKQSGSPYTLSLIYTSIVSVIERNGGKVFGTEGDDYNPEMHELVGYSHLDADPTIGNNQVSRVLNPGIMLENGNVIRPAKVVVKLDS